MVKVCIISNNQTFAEDLKSQIERIEENVEISLSFSKNATIIFIDEDEEILEYIYKENKNQSYILLSANKDFSEYADIVIKKPFNLYEFLTKFKNKNLLPKVSRKEFFSFREYTVYPIKKEIESSLTGKTIKLTEKEVDILKYLHKNSQNISNKESLLEHVWGYSAEATTHTVETHIYRLRQKVEEKDGSQLIITENNGYRLNI